MIYVQEVLNHHASDTVLLKKLIPPIYNLIKKNVLYRVRLFSLPYIKRSFINRHIGSIKTPPDITSKSKSDSKIKKSTSKSK